MLLGNKVKMTHQAWESNIKLHKILCTSILQNANKENHAPVYSASVVNAVELIFIPSLLHMYFSLEKPCSMSVTLHQEIRHSLEEQKYTEKK